MTEKMKLISYKFKKKKKKLLLLKEKLNIYAKNKICILGFCFIFFLSLSPSIYIIFMSICTYYSKRNIDCIE